MLLSDFTQKAITRQVSCHLLSSLAEVIGKDFKGLLLQRVKSLSQDTNPEVREEMSKAWLKIINAVGKIPLEEMIFFDILKLIEDEIETVKCNGIRLFIDCIGYLSDQFFTKEAAPFIVSYVYSSQNIAVDLTVSENIGKLVEGCHGVFRAENIQLIRRLLAKDQVYRKNLAYNFPGLAQLMSLCSEMKDIAQTLANDSDALVKVTFAAGFHEVLALSKNCKILKKIAIKLIEDNDTKTTVFKKLTYWSPIFDPSFLLSKYIKVLTLPIDWRTQSVLIYNFQEALGNFDLKDILDNLVPLLLHKMMTSYWPIKSAASELLARIIKNTFYISRKLDICNIIKEKLARSPCCYDRMLFIEFLTHMCKLVSKKFFTKHFFDDYLCLSGDPNHSVRLKFLIAGFVIGTYTNFDQIGSLVKTVEYAEMTSRNTANELIDYFRSKGFIEKHTENMMKDRQKEVFETQQEIQEVNELESAKKRNSEEAGAKTGVDVKNKKVPVKGKVYVESSDLKLRGARSTAIIKPSLPAKKK